MGVSSKRKQYASNFKAKVALESIKEIHTINEIASKYGIHPTLVNRWKKQLKEKVVDIFSNNQPSSNHHTETQESRLYEEIGRLKVELDWLKKKYNSFS